VLFAACANSGNPPAQPAQPMMVILKADDGKILTSLPLAGGSDGAEFNPSTTEAFSTHGNGTLTVVKEKSPTSFEVEQNLETMNGARTDHIGPQDEPRPDDQPGAWASAAATTRRRPRSARYSGTGFVYHSDDRQVRASQFRIPTAVARALVSSWSHRTFVLAE
jgi:hypothetical protein